MATAKNVADLLRSSELDIAVDRRVRLRPAGVATTLDSGEVITVTCPDPEVVAKLDLGPILDLGGKILDLVGGLLDGGGEGGGGDTVTVTVTGAGGRKVTVTIN